MDSSWFLKAMYYGNDTYKNNYVKVRVYCSQKIMVASPICPETTTRIDTHSMLG